MERRVSGWLSLPVVIVLVMAGLAIGGRLTGTAGPALGFFAIYIAVPIAWIVSWAFVKPKIGFWIYTAIGFVSMGLVMAVHILLRNTWGSGPPWG